jgi:hypothetical protein
MAGQSAEKCSVWEWTEDRQKAAVLLAQDELTDMEIVAQCGIAERTLYKWKKVPEFAARVKELAEEFGNALMRYAIARKQRRVALLDKTRARIEALIEARAAALEYRDAVGGFTGLLAHDVKQIGSGENAERVDVYTADVALLKELREIAKQAAIECGQCDEKAAGSNGGQNVQVIIHIPDNGRDPLPPDVILRKPQEIAAEP